MSDFRDIEVKAGNHSLIITIIIGLLSLLFLLISFTFEQPQPKVQPIEIAMNFGNSELGQGEEEPQPNEASQSASAQSESLSSQTQSDIKEAVTKPTAEKVPTASKPKKKTSQPQKTQKAKTNPKPTPKPQGDAKGKAALKNLLSGKGKSNSSGQGNDGVAGNVGDPKGNDSYGTTIGENWKSRIPEPQSHNCTASGVIIVDIVVTASGNIKSARAGARGSSSNDSCLKAKAKELVKKYVRAYPGKDGRRGSYRVNLR